MPKTARQRYRMAFAMLGLGVLITSCSGDGGESSEPLPAYDSLDAAYAEVDEVLGCDADRATEPIVDRSAGAPMAEYAVCSELLQIVWFQDEADRVSGQRIYADGSDPIYMVEGQNWLVIDLAEAVGKERSEKDLEALATELGANYQVLNSAEES